MSTPKYKFLRLNFDDYVVKSSKNEIYILKDRTLDLVQILRSHDNEISLMTHGQPMGWIKMQMRLVEVSKMLSAGKVPYILRLKLLRKAFQGLC